MNLRKFFLLTSFLLFGTGAFSQAHLRITSLTGFPIMPLDTAYGNLSYDSIQIGLTNTGNLAYNDITDIILQGNPGNPDTLYTDSVNLQLSAGALDTAIVHIPSYHFTSTNYDGGDNIVVVWPAARNAFFPSDTITFHIYFVDLQGIDELNNYPLTIYPNPTDQFISFHVKGKNMSQHVRIFNSVGDLVIDLKSSRDFIPVSDIPAGLYLVEIIQQDGKRLAGKILKY